MIVFLIVALAISVNAESTNSSHRIIGGGYVQKIQDTPYIVSVLKNDKHICGGVIISKYNIVTAASCVSTNFISEYRIRAGSLGHKYGGSIHIVYNIIVHPEFKILNGIPENDIAIIDLFTPIHLDEYRGIISPTFLPAKPYSIGKILGWGYIDSINGYANRLKEASVVVLDSDYCRDHELNGYLPKGQICAKQVDASACMGDGGGPLVINERFAGIISWGKNACEKGLASVYTDIYKYKSWITSNLTTRE